MQSPKLLIALNMAGGVCLLLWGSYMVRMAVERAYSNRIGSLVSAAGSRLRAFVIGVFSATALQSATAAILLTTSLVTSGLLPLTTAVAVILGADVGSAIAVRVLYLDLSFLPPLLLCIGLGLHRLSTSWRHQQLGRIFLGLGLILLSIQLLRQAIEPLAEAPPDAALLSALNALPLIALLVSALFTWAAHSSVAVVLIIASLADGGLVGAPLFVFAVVGANFGSGLIALFLANRRHLDSYSAVLANFLMRGALGLLVLLFAAPIEAHINLLGASGGAQVISTHLLFNLILALIFVPFSGSAARFAKWLIVSRSPEAVKDAAIAPGASLDPALVTKPKRALSCARREAFRLADNTEALFADALAMFEADDRSSIEQFVSRDKEINARHKAIQRYLSEVRRHLKEGRNEIILDQILCFSATMENIGDVISHGLARLAVKRLDRGAAFSTAGLEELQSVHDEVLKVMQLDITNFTANDRLSRKAIDKQIGVALELGRDSIDRHRLRLSERKTSSIDSSSIHQDLVRDLIQVVRCVENRHLN